MKKAVFRSWLYFLSYFIFLNAPKTLKKSSNTPWENKPSLVLMDRTSEPTGVENLCFMLWRYVPLMAYFDDSSGYSYLTLKALTGKRCHAAVNQTPRKNGAIKI